MPGPPARPRPRPAPQTAPVRPYAVEESTRSRVLSQSASSYTYAVRTGANNSSVMNGEWGSVDLQDGRVDEPALGVVGVAADDDDALGPGLGERLRVLGVLLTIDHGADVGLGFGRVAHDDAVGQLDEPFAQCRPQAPGRIETRGCRALLALELVGTAHAGDGEGVEVRRGVGEDEVLPAGLADNAGIVAIGADVLPDSAPDVLEGAGRAGEVNGGQVAVVESHGADLGTAAVDDVDDAVRQAGLA